MSEQRFKPGDDPVPTHTVEFVRIDGADALVKYVPGEYVPRGGLPPLDPTAAADAELRARSGAQKKRRVLAHGYAIAAVTLAVATLVLCITGITLALDGSYGASQIIAFFALGTSLLGLVAGGTSLFLHRARWVSALAMVLCVVANPVLLAQVLGWASEVLTP